MFEILIILLYVILPVFGIWAILMLVQALQSIATSLKDIAAALKQRE